MPTYRHTYVFADGVSESPYGSAVVQKPLITTNANYPSDMGFLFQGGSGLLAVGGTTGGGTFQLQQRLPDMQTWVNVPGAVLNGIGVIPFAAAESSRLRLAVSGSSGASATAYLMDLPEGTSFSMVSTTAPGSTNAAYVQQAPLTKTDRSVVASTTNTVAVPANATRTRIMVENQDATNTVYVNFGAAASATVSAGNGSKRIGPQGVFEFTGTSQALNIIATAGTPAVTIWEF